MDGRAIVGVLGTERLELRHLMMMMVMAIVMVRAKKKEMPWERTTIFEWAGQVMFLPVPSI